MNTFLKDAIDNMRRTEQSTTYLNVTSRMQHAILGFADESGELIQILLRATYYNQPIDINNYKEELGDMLWYLCLAVDDLAETEKRTPEGVFQEILNINKAKLKARYPEKYSNLQAKCRDLSTERHAMNKAIADTNDEKEKTQKI